MGRRRAVQIILGGIALFLVGTVVVLSSVSYYLYIDPSAYLSEREVPYVDDFSRINVSSAERIPRIMHQTWKTDVLPEKWLPVSKSCRDLMPDYEYILWSDESARTLISDHYSWFLETYDHYPYNIQRADALRYFVLLHYGGIYIDLDIGCLRPLDSLLVYPLTLPKTIPVGVSNDLMFAEKDHPFMAQTIHNLATFDNNLMLNYPTVMFSTGPMFLSAQYATYSASHPNSIRVLPKSLYGKNAKDGEAPHSFFTHYYGSSWHADDAGFIWFLGTKGKWLMWIGLAIVVVGALRLAIPASKQRKYRYTLFSSRRSSRSGSPANSSPSSPSSSHIPLTPSGTRSEGSQSGAFPLIFQKLRSTLATRREDSASPSRGRQSRGVLSFLPTFFTKANQDIELGSRSSPDDSDMPTTSNYPPEKQKYARDFERAGLFHILDIDETTPSDSSSMQPTPPSRSRSVSRHRDP